MSIFRCSWVTSSSVRGAGAERQAHLGLYSSLLTDEAKLERTLRRSAAELEAKAAEVDDPELKQAIDTYVAKMQRVAVRAEQGRIPDLGDLEAANGALVDACS